MKRNYRLFNVYENCYRFREKISISSHIRYTVEDVDDRVM